MTMQNLEEAEYESPRAPSEHGYLGSIVKFKDQKRLALHVRVNALEQGERPWFLKAGRVLGIPEIVVDTAMSYRKSLQKKGVFRSVAGTKEACLFLACRQHGMQVTPQMVARLYSGLRPMKLLKLAYGIADELGIEVRPAEHKREYFGAIEKLGLSIEFYKSIMTEFHILRSKEFTDHRPSTDAAALTCILAEAIEVFLTQAAVAEAFGIPAATLASGLRDLRALGYDRAGLDRRTLPWMPKYKTEEKGMRKLTLDLHEMGLKGSTIRKVLADLNPQRSRSHIYKIVTDILGKDSEQEAAVESSQGDVSN
jgi:hypothetical protein